jgi:hypothetical protein
MWEKISLGVWTWYGGTISATIIRYLFVHNLDLIFEIVLHLSGIQDFVHFSSTCRTLKWQLSSLLQRTITRLAFKTKLGFLNTPQNIPLASTTRQITAWARILPENALKLFAGRHSRQPVIGPRRSFT